MMQMLQVFVERFGAWLAADPSHGELWRSLGMLLTICCIALLAFDQVKAQIAEQQQ